MWYYGEHRRSWVRKHSLDILTAVGLFMVFGIPIWVLFT